MVLGMILGMAGTASAYPSVFPTGVTINKPDKTCSGYTVLNPLRATPHGVPLIDMNGKVVHKWMNVEGQPAKVLPGGNLLATLVHYDPADWLSRKSEGFTVAELDWDGNVIWSFDRYEQRKPTAEMVKVTGDTYWSSNAHHDIQREGNPVGYDVPGMSYVKDGKTLIAGFKTIDGRDTATLYIVDRAGNIVWEWIYRDHEEEYKARGIADFQNTASWVGPNKWYESDPVRYAAFHPDNIITDDGQEVIYIIDHKTGNIVWQVAPPFVGADAALAPITGVHGTHMIPRGLPGEGNILLFDNGGTMPGDLYADSQAHAWSRIIEFNPVDKTRVWEYSAATMKVSPGQHGYKFFFSPYISIAQRLPNGNTLIDEGACSRIFEVTPMGEIVWEYRSPYGYAPAMKANTTYRAYAVPYEWVPQLKKPVETPVTAPVEPKTFIMLPDDKGNIPNFRTTLDKRPVVQFDEPWVVSRPAKR